MHVKLGMLLCENLGLSHEEAAKLVAQNGNLFWQRADRALSALGADVSCLAQVMGQFRDEASHEALHSEGVASRLTELADAMALTHTHRQEAQQRLTTILQLVEKLRLFVSTIQLPDVPLLESEAALGGQTQAETETGIR
jgi:hypothetical protein